MDATVADSEGGCRVTDSGSSQKIRRQPKADFLSSFVALQGAVSGACSGEQQWQEKVAAGIRAALEFVTADPLGRSRPDHRRSSPAPARG